MTGHNNFTLMSEPVARDVMTEEVVAVDKETSVEEAASMMASHDIRGLVVVDDGTISGVIAGKDILYGVVAEGRAPGDVTVEDVMTAPAVTADALASLREVSDTMLDKGISRLPIVEGGKLVGIITRTNLVKAWPGYVDVIQESGFVDYRP